MKRLNLDCLIVASGSIGFDKGWSNMRYLTNYAGSLDLCAYTVLGRDGEPTICNATTQIDRVARSVVNDIRGNRNTVATAVERVKELKAQSGNVGIVGLNFDFQLPFEHWDFLKKELPGAKFQFVFEDFMRDVRWLKSAEEITCIEKAAHLGDLWMEALAAKVKPGITEGEVYGIVYESIYKNGGEPAAILMSTTDTFDSDSPDTRVRPMPRVLKKGFLINSENGSICNGYESQTGKPICIGEPSPQYREMWNICLEAYKRVVDQLRPGRKEQDIQNAGKIIYDSGYMQVGAPFCHGMYGAHPYDGPTVTYGGSLSGHYKPLVIKPNTMWTVEISVATEDEMKGVFMADSYMITDGAPRCLNRYPAQLTVV